MTERIASSGIVLQQPRLLTQEVKDEAFVSVRWHLSPSCHENAIREKGEGTRMQRSASRADESFVPPLAQRLRHHFDVTLHVARELSYWLVFLHKRDIV